MFAESGFADVSMRKLAKAINMSVAAIYHYFPDKNTLYLETVKFAFKDKANNFSEIWRENVSAERKLELFITTFIHELILDQEFHRLIQRELIDANSERMKILAEDVFKEQFLFLLSITKQIAPHYDAHLAAISILSLCKHHLEMQPIRRYLPEWKDEHERPEVIAKHVTNLILKGLG